MTKANLVASSGSFDRLQMLSDILPSIDTREVTDDALKTARDLVQQLQDQLDDIDIDTRLKSFLRMQTSQLLWSIDNFEFVGIDNLARVWGATVAEMTRATSMKGADSPEARSWFQRARSVAKEVGNAVIFAGAVVGAVSGSVVGVDAALDAITHSPPAAATPEGPAAGVVQV